MSITIQNNFAKFLVRLADTEIILGQRLAEMCSKGPTLEEDIALSNLALDLFGRGEELLKMVAQIEGGQTTADDYTFRRNEREYFCLKLVEQPNTDFAWVIARQLMHDIYVKQVFTQLLESDNAEIKGLSEKVLKEINYALEHARDWFLRLGIGTEESHSRLQNAVTHLWQFVQEIFNFDDIDNEFLSDTESIKTAWFTQIETLFNETKINAPETEYYHYLDYRQGFHSEHLGMILADMQYLPRAYPDAKW